MIQPRVEWQNRIVGYDPAVPLDQLLAHPQNPKIHPTEQTDAVKAIIARLGWLDTVKVNVRTQHVLDGHDRIKAAMQAGQRTAPVQYVDVPEEDEFLVLGSYDFVGAMAVTDTGIYADQLAALQAEDAALLAGLWRDDELAALVPPAEIVPGNGGDEFDATPAPGPTRAQVGDVWAIGAHRLLVGDSTDPANVARLMGGKKAAIILTDPPYGMSLATDWSDRVGTWERNTKKYDAIAGDDVSFNRTAVPVSAAEEFWFGADYYVDTLPDCGKAGSWLVWDKRQEGTVDEMRGNAFELCWSKQRHRRELIRIVWIGVLGHNKKDDGPIKAHPTQKPVKLFLHFLDEYSQDGALVLDPFLGSGTTLIAAHRTGRICYGCELSPAYADVVLRRAEAEGIGPIERLTATEDCNAR